MTERKDELRRAARSAERCDVSFVENAIAEIPLSPLGELIAYILPSLPPGPQRDALERIKNLKQGMFDDLNDPEFQSFLISYLRIDFSLLRVLTQILRTQHLVGSGCLATVNLEIAARGDATGAPLSSDELDTILSQRRF